MTPSRASSAPSWGCGDTPKSGKLPLHIDVNPTDRDQAAELERLLEIGARPADVGQTGEESWHVLADPEGNEFCLLRRQLSGRP
ncbi:VOC family protein [Nonomuraea dietziae]|uniref:VOC family protein n=1 Tax=Nonomuraea dietziae TaxID=65515 RepID=UPI0033E51888